MDRPPSPSAPSSSSVMDASIVSDALSAAMDARSDRSADDDHSETSGRKRGNSSLERERDSDDESVATGPLDRPPSPSAPSSSSVMDASIVSDALSAAMDARSDRSADDDHSETSGRKRGKVLARSHQQLKRLLGSTVRRTVDKARSIAQVRAHESGGHARSQPRLGTGQDSLQRESRRHDDTAERLGATAQQAIIDQPKV
ncbi:hypothetical protein J437_LFUL011183, partial [Ladona fulva]